MKNDALVVLAGVVCAACAGESPGGPSPVADVAVATNTSGPAVIDLWGPGAPQLDARNVYASAVSQAGVVVGRIGSQVVVWDHGTLTNLGAVVDNASYASWINDAGDVLGAMGLCNIAVTECEGRAVLWRRGNPIPLTLGGNRSRPAGLNAAGQAVGEAS